MRIVGYTLAILQIICQFLTLLVIIIGCSWLLGMFSATAWDHVSPVTKARMTSWIPRRHREAR